MISGRTLLAKICASIQWMITYPNSQILYAYFIIWPRHIYYLSEYLLCLCPVGLLIVQPNPATPHWDELWKLERNDKIFGKKWLFLKKNWSKNDDSSTIRQKFMIFENDYKIINSNPSFYDVIWKNQQYFPKNIDK